MSAKIIDGKKLSQALLQKVAEKTTQINSKKARPPCLSVILVGENPASHIYVEHKKKACLKVGFQSHIHKLSKTTKEGELVALINTLNSDKGVDGILLQLPLPPQFNTLKIIEHITPSKDVDGLTAHNQGLLSLGTPQHIPCTPLGIISLLKSISYNLKGKTACVIGRSILVGSPIAKLLTLNDATVTQVHSKTITPKKYTSQSDLLIVAAGQANLVDHDWIKKRCYCY